ncbi:enterotoxin A family protein [Yersinia pekkanenii]|uniref:Heat-labile enterotoxin IIB, A chain n=1 Tax=Yersinia pekkanenii TaxID=1288385 RepID=A0A0T9P754_9GAMM|nr:enterotoxin A family protein [Yersinia pekkanenii]CNH49246.1 Heat-labile enterotoxin IIB%2C A chain precursor [Yersinia pekkanenii]CRY67905.1 Heat-labile enterotoxin IIB%2C A chain precursor [Yersinia pekkanenii]
MLRNGYFILYIIMLLIPIVTFAIHPVSVVYRADSRTPEEIVQAGGMYPFTGLPPDIDLLHHFEGESLEGYTSAFISTTASLRQAVEHAAFTARINDEEPFDTEFETYLYVIRPSINFYNIDESLNYIINETPDNSDLYKEVSRTLHSYGGMNEWVALGGFAQTRIISYARITGDMLQQHYHSGQIFSSSFWDEHWQNNPLYLSALDQDLSSSVPYFSIGVPRGYITMLQNEAGQQLPLVNTCHEEPSTSDSRIKRQLSRVTCQNKAFTTSRYFYNTELLLQFLNILSELKINKKFDINIEQDEEEL